MSERRVVLGCDPGLAKFGWALVELRDKWEVLELGCITTVSSTTKAGVTASGDLANRARLLHAELLTQLANHSIRPLVICSEAMSYPRVPGKGGRGSTIAVKATAQMGYAWGIICALSNECDGAPIVQASPQEIKKSLCGRGNATKADVQEALKIRFKQLALFEKLNKGQVEHAADALGAIVACRDTEIMRMARRQATEDRNE